MKRTLLFFATFFFLSMTVTSFAQNKSLNKAQEKKKTERKKDASISANNEKAEPEKEAEIVEYTMPIFTPVVAIAAPIEKKIKLKVTLLEIQSAATQNGELAHLSINQHVRYESKGKILRPISQKVNNIKSNRAKCPLGYLRLTPGFGEIEAPYLEPDADEWQSTPLACGDRDSQIHVPQSTQPLTRNPNINHHLVFELTPDQVNDKNAEFLIDTFVVEYSTDWKGKDTSIKLLHDPRRTKVAIHDVLAILQGKKELKANTSYVKDGGVPASFKFDHFDGASLPLRNVNPNGKIILEGPIRARNKGKKLIEKAFVWMRFELID